MGRIYDIKIYRRNFDAALKQLIEGTGDPVEIAETLAITTCTYEPEGEDWLKAVLPARSLEGKRIISQALEASNNEAQRELLADALRNLESSPGIWPMRLKNQARLEDRIQELRPILDRVAFHIQVTLDLCKIAGIRAPRFTPEIKAALKPVIEDILAKILVLTSEENPDILGHVLRDDYEYLLDVRPVLKQAGIFTGDSGVYGQILYNIALDGVLEDQAWCYSEDDFS